MKVVDIGFDIDGAAPPSPPRTPGLHLSDLIREMERTRFGDAYRPEKVEGDETARGYWEMGLTWELAYEIALAIRYANDKPLLQVVKGGPIVRPGVGREVWLRQHTVVDVSGISMTPDVFDVKRRRVVEFKWTTRSMARADEGTWEKNFYGYTTQMKSYCRYWETREAELVVCFAVGDWKFKAGTAKPTFRRWLFRFEDREIEGNWRAVLAEKKAWEARGGKPRAYGSAARREKDERANDAYRRLSHGTIGAKANAARREAVEVESIGEMIGVDRGDY